MKLICFLFVHISLACKLSTTSSNSETADGAVLLRIKFILKSLGSLAIPGAPIDTNSASGRSTSVTEVLSEPLALLGSEL